MVQILFLFLIMLAWPAVVDACSCAWPGRPCAAYADTHLIFSGRVTDISTVKLEGDYEQRLVRFELIELFKGTVKGALEVVTGRGGGDCGYSFRRGGEYLVYAHRWEKLNRLYTGICSRTRALTEAREDLDYFHRMKEPNLGAGILGQIERLKRVPANSVNTEWDGWLGNARVVVSQGSQRWEARTDSKGQFELWGLQRGTYGLTAELPPGYVGGEIEKVEIKPGAPCSEVRILAVPEYKPPPKKK